MSILHTDHDSVSIGALTLSWFLCKPGANEAQGLWFWRVMRILQHKGPDGETRVVFEAQWHESKAIDSYYRRANLIK